LTVWEDPVYSKRIEIIKWGEIAMIALKIEDLKLFTSKLFVGEVFDQFLAKEAVIVTFNTFTIDGRGTGGNEYGTAFYLGYDEAFLFFIN